MRGCGREAFDLFSIDGSRIPIHFVHLEHP